MNIRDHAEKTAKDVLSALDVSSDDGENTRKVSDIIESEMVRVALDTRNWCADKALELGASGKDEAYKFSEDLRRETETLIANLSSLR